MAKKFILPILFLFGIELQAASWEEIKADIVQAISKHNGSMGIPVVGTRYSVLS